MSTGVERGRGRRFWAPEIIQTSASDCGAACLTSLLRGFGVEATYRQIRDFCFTEADGASIDDLEDVAIEFGLDAHQTTVAVEHFFSLDAGTLPSIVVLRGVGGATHFVVLWRRVGNWIQVMNPSYGRRWVHCRRLQEMLYVHETEVYAEDWRAWAETEAFLGPLSERMLARGISKDDVVQLLKQGLEDKSWESLAVLDAATRLIEAVGRTQCLVRRRETVGAWTEVARRVPLREQASWLPREVFGVTAKTIHTPDPRDIKPPFPMGLGREGKLIVRGAILIIAAGPRHDCSTSRTRGAGSANSPPLVRDPTTLQQLWAYIVRDGGIAPTAVVVTAILAGCLVALEALIFKGLLELGRIFPSPEQRSAAVLGIATFGAILTYISLQQARGVRSLGRRVETYLRIDFLNRLPRLPDVYFLSRLMSDLAMRVHSVVEVRQFPRVGEAILRRLASLLSVTAGICWLAPSCSPYALVAMVTAIGLPLLSQSRLSEMQLSLATHRGGLSRFLLDALRGGLALKAHSGEATLRYEHDKLLSSWTARRGRLVLVSVILDTFISATGMAMSGVILHVHLNSSGSTSSVLLLLFWAQQLPSLGRGLARDIVEYPASRAAAARILEPINSVSAEPGEVPEQPPVLGKPMDEEEPTWGWLGGQTDGPHAPSISISEPPALSLCFKNVTLEMSRRTVLHDLTFDLPAGAACAIVGASGAGKSSVLGLLLGWHRPNSGIIEVDHERLDDQGIAALRRRVAWVDQDVQLWNRSLLYNLTFGVSGSEHDVTSVIQMVGLGPTIERLPEGLATCLGEGGNLLSQGERQRVRLGRALGRVGAPLVLLDEPFRGLERETRLTFHGNLRRWWPKASILCITHDVEKTLSFDRVLVLEHGRPVEFGTPEELARRPNSVYLDLLEDDRAVRRRFDDRTKWNHWVMEAGRLETKKKIYKGEPQEEIKVHRYLSEVAAKDLKG